MHVTDREAYQSIATVLAELATIKKLYGDKLELSGDVDNPIAVQRIERVIIKP